MQYLGEFLSHLKIEYKLSPLTIAAYKTDLDGYFTFAQSDWSNISQVNNYLVSLKHKPNTLWRKRAALVRFFKFLWEEDIIQSDLTNQIYRPALPKTLPKALGQSEILAILEAAKHNASTPNGQRIYTLLVLLYYSAMRVTECISITLQNIYQDKILITGKRNKQRWVFLLPEISILLKAYLDIRDIWCNMDNSYLWGIKPKGHVSRQTVGRWLKDIARPLDIEISPHIMRHTQATQLLPHINIIDLAAILGHSSVNTTSKYLKVTPQTLIEQVKKFHPLK